ncbi:hypothetical protein PYCC9005_002038 [Savitreella phatthalungensis]
MLTGDHSRLYVLETSTDLLRQTPSPRPRARLPAKADDLLTTRRRSTATLLLRGILTFAPSFVQSQLLPRLHNI